MIQRLTALSPLDGRYAEHITAIASIGSEAGLIRYRVRVELHWLLVLAQEPQISEIKAPDAACEAWLLGLENNCDVAAIKTIERTTNHDVKAVEYWLKQQLQTDPFWCNYAEFVHFSCTSEDINNLAYALMAADLREILLNQLDGIATTLADMASSQAAQPMLSLTHGQPASPTTLGKELANLHARLLRQTKGLLAQQILGKFNGAVGNFNAHLVAYPEVNWPDMAQLMVEGLGLGYNPLTTQIEPHDWIAEYCHQLVRINTVLLDFARDMWGYIARGLFRLALKEEEVGSSTMPHKVNPIDFENAEGNLGVANALLEHLAARLPVSRWQRDLSDSTVLRNLGSVAGYCAIAYQALARGLGKVVPNTQQLMQELEANPEVLAEAVQTLMRRYGVDRPYEKVKELTRGNSQLDLATIATFIDQQPLPDAAKSRLKALRPQNYTGLAQTLAEQKSK